MNIVKRVLFFIGRFSFFILVLAISIIMIFLSQDLDSAGLKSWSNFFTTIGTLLLSIINMYFGYKIEHQRQQRRNDTKEIEESLGKVSDSLYQIRILQKLPSVNDRDCQFYKIQNETKSILQDMPSPKRIKDTNTQREIENGITFIISSFLIPMNEFTNADDMLAKVSLDKVEEKITQACESMKNYEQSKL